MNSILFEAPGGKLKGAEPTGFLASIQPAPPPAQPVATQSHRLEKVTARVKYDVKAELQRIADREGVSLSNAGAAFIERGVRGDIAMQTDALLKPIIQETIRQELRAFTNRFLAVISRISYHVAWLLSLNIKYMSLKINKEIFQGIETRAETEARTHITEHTPQFEEVKQRIKKEMEESA